MFILRLALFTLLQIYLYGCGSSQTDSQSDKNSSDSTGRKKNEASELQSLQTENPKNNVALLELYGITVEQASKMEAGVFAVYSNNRYFQGYIVERSPQLYDIQGGVGYYNENNGTIDLQPKKSTCPAMRGSGIRRWQRGASGSDVIAGTSGSKTVLLKRIPVDSSRSINNGLVIRWGCFDKNENLTEADWQSVN